MISTFQSLKFFILVNETKIIKEPQKEDLVGREKENRPDLRKVRPLHWLRTDEKL